MIDEDEKFDRLKRKLGIFDYSCVDHDGDSEEWVSEQLPKLMPFGSGKNKSVVVTQIQMSDTSIVILSKSPLTRDQVAAFKAARKKAILDPYQ